jgi:trk system potassium uptake protein TrkA
LKTGQLANWSILKGGVFSMKQFIVLGLGRFGSAVATTLVELGNEVLGVDNDEERVNDLKDKITQAVQADITEERALKELGVKNFDTAIVGIGSDLETSILVTMMLKEMGVKTIVAKAQNNLHAKVLQKIGVDKIVFPERDMGRRIASNLVIPNIKDYIEMEPDYSIIEISALPEFVDNTLKKLDLQNKYGINVLAIKRENNFNISPQAKDVIKKNDFLIIIGETKKISELIDKVNH